MAKQYRTTKRSSAAKASDWLKICEACCGVIERARGRREIGSLTIKTGASEDTLGRMLDDPEGGHWSGPRIIALRAWEEERYGTQNIRAAWNASGMPDLATCLDSQADAALVRVLNLSRSIAESRPKGIDRNEARALLAVLPDAIEALVVLQRAAKDKLRGQL